jgi:hypothetical protein
MVKLGLSMSKDYHSRMKTRNIDRSTTSELVNASDSDQYDVEVSDKTVEDFEYSSTSNSSEQKSKTHSCINVSHTILIPSSLLWSLCYQLLRKHSSCATLASMKMTVFWDVVPCSLVGV